MTEPETESRGPTLEEAARELEVAARDPQLRRPMLALPRPKTGQRGSTVIIGVAAPQEDC